MSERGSVRKRVSRACPDVLRARGDGLNLLEQLGHLEMFDGHLYAAQQAVFPAIGDMLAADAAEYVAQSRRTERAGKVPGCNGHVGPAAIRSPLCQEVDPTNSPERLTTPD